MKQEGRSSTLLPFLKYSLAASPCRVSWGGSLFHSQQKSWRTLLSLLVRENICPGPLLCQGNYSNHTGKMTPPIPPHCEQLGKKLKGETEFFVCHVEYRISCCLRGVSHEKQKWVTWILLSFRRGQLGDVLVQPSSATLYMKRFSARYQKKIDFFRSSCWNCENTCFPLCKQKTYCRVFKSHGRMCACPRAAYKFLPDDHLQVSHLRSWMENVVHSVHRYGWSPGAANEK